ncbi:hypothetical protein D3C80_1483120 [compost metagenome]
MGLNHTADEARDTFQPSNTAHCRRRIHDIHQHIAGQKRTRYRRDNATANDRFTDSFERKKNFHACFPKGVFNSFFRLVLRLHHEPFVFPRLILCRHGKHGDVESLRVLHLVEQRRKARQVIKLRVDRLAGGINLHVMHHWCVPR